MTYNKSTTFSGCFCDNNVCFGLFSDSLRKLLCSGFQRVLSQCRDVFGWKRKPLNAGRCQCLFAHCCIVCLRCCPGARPVLCECSSSGEPRFCYILSLCLPYCTHNAPLYTFPLRFGSFGAAQPLYVIAKWCSSVLVLRLCSTTAWSTVGLVAFMILLFRLQTIHTKIIFEVCITTKD